MTLPDRMKFGIFLAPFHVMGENPTLSLVRDLELIQWLDHLAEAWIGEHHTGDWETIDSPEVFIGGSRLAHEAHQPGYPASSACHTTTRTWSPTA